MIIVWRDSDGDAWVRISEDRVAQAVEVAKGQAYADQWSDTIEDVEAMFGPLTVEWEVPEP